MDANQKARIYVSAVMCHELIQESETNTFTAIRIGNSYKIDPIEITPVFTGIGKTPNYPAMKIYQPLHVKILLIFRSEESADFTISMRGIKPDGEPYAGGFDDVEGKVRGAMEEILSVPVSLPTDIPGTYWFEVHINGELATKLPLTIVHPGVTFQSGKQVVKLNIDVIPKKND